MPGNPQCAKSFFDCPTEGEKGWGWGIRGTALSIQMKLRFHRRLFCPCFDCMYNRMTSESRPKSDNLQQRDRDPLFAAWLHRGQESGGGGGVMSHHTHGWGTEQSIERTRPLC